MKFALLIFGGFVALLMFVVFGIGSWGLGVYNTINKEAVNVDAQWGNLQSTYQRRNDLIPNFVNTVKGAAKFEGDTLTNIAKARASVGQVTIQQNKAPESAEQLQSFEKAQGNISQALSRLMMVTENYPALKATQQYANLTIELEGTENRISVERRNYNGVVKKYNQVIVGFPNSLIAGFFNFKSKPFFKADESAQSAPVVKFD